MKNFANLALAIFGIKPPAPGPAPVNPPGIHPPLV